MKGSRKVFGATVLLGLLVLSGCSQQVLFSTPYQVRLEPAQLGYQVDEANKITIVGNNAYVEVAPGAPEGVLLRYECLYIDDSGQEAVPGASLKTGDVGLPFPPGYKQENGQIVYQRTRSEGSFSFSLDGAIAQAHLQAGAPLNWRARVTWYARLTNGQLVSWTQEYQIKFPLGGQ